MLNLFSLLLSPWPIYFSVSVFLSWLQSTPALINTDGWWCFAASPGHGGFTFGGNSGEVIYVHGPALAAPQGSGVSHLMMKSAWSMSRPHLLCRRMPPLPTTAHFFRGSCRGFSWAGENMQLCLVYTQTQPPGRKHTEPLTHMHINKY